MAEKPLPDQGQRREGVISRRRFLGLVGKVEIEA